MSEWIVTDGDEGPQLAGPFPTEEAAEKAAEALQAEGRENAVTAFVN